MDSVFDTIRKSRVHRFVVIDEKSRLRGVLTLSDILEYVLTAEVSQAVIDAWNADPENNF